MSAQSTLAQLLQQVMVHIPGLGVAAVGLTLSFLNFAKLRSAALPATIGCTVYLLAHLIQPVFYAVLVPRLASGAGPQTLGSVLLGFNLLFSAAYTVSFGLLVWAALAGRTNDGPKPVYGP